ncbi:MAG TPA: hypothetical protein DDW52_16925, partial [Planctomycetaceae bacterium]|nr:hypothetical protein [Planctomycetaceae bacterium]
MVLRLSTDMKANFTIAAVLMMISTTAMAQSIDDGPYFDLGTSVLDVPSTLVSAPIGGDEGCVAAPFAGGVQCTGSSACDSSACDSFDCDSVFDGGCDSGYGCDSACGCQQPGWEFSGWLNGGFMGNF